MTTRVKFLSAALIAAAAFATPVMAREHHAVSRHVSADASVMPRAPYGESYLEGRACIPAPRVGAFASQPWASPPCEPFVAY
jgi:hypothetical protein